MRALYFAIAGLMQIFHHLNYGLCIILIFVGVKMLVSSFFEIPSLVALGVITLVLILSIIASLIWPKMEMPELAVPDPDLNRHHQESKEPEQITKTK